MQLQVNLLIELDEVPDAVATRLKEHEQKLALSLEDIADQLGARKVTGRVLAQKLLQAREALSSLDRCLLDSSKTMQSYEEAVTQREVAFVKAQTELLQQDAEHSEVL